MISSLVRPAERPADARADEVQGKERIARDDPVRLMRSVTATTRSHTVFALAEFAIRFLPCGDVDDVDRISVLARC